MVPLDFGGMRASTADRERAVDVLKAAFAEGRLDQSEYADRVGLVYSSRTYAELASLTADLPVGPLGTMPVIPVQPGYVPPGYGQPGYGPPGVTYVPVPVPVQPVPTTPPARQTNGMAVAAFVFGLGTFVTAGITAPIALVLAVAAAIRVRQTGEQGVGLSAAAIALTLIALLFVPWA
jgi:Domain of unknown function (DUF1707)